MKRRLVAPVGPALRQPLTAAELHARRAAGMPVPEALLCIAYGMGWDSTALLVELARRGVHPDKILFADTGGEKPETYQYLPVIQQCLQDRGLVPVEVVCRTPVRVAYTTLEQNCLTNRTLPSLAFGHKSCSLKWKREPQDGHVRRWPLALAAWGRGERMVKAIGYDAGPKDMRRSALADDAEYIYWYPLQLWGWDRARCAREIQAAGLPLPAKSSCFFCPGMQEEEIAALGPDLLARIIRMERAASPYLDTVKGLWRSRSMESFIRALPGDPVRASGLIELAMGLRDLPRPPKTKRFAAAVGACGTQLSLLAA